MPNVDEFMDLELDTSSLSGLQDPTKNRSSNQNGLSGFQRFAVKNIFDTQPKNRKKYLNRLGYDMSPDGEGYRPIGSDGGFQPIEPDDGVLGVFTNLFTSKGREEILRDFGDVAFDVLISGPLAGAGTIAGAAKGGAALGATGLVAGGPAGAAAGATIGSVLGGVAGGAAGNASAETIKLGIGAFLLDGDVTIDAQEAAYQSLVAGGLGVAGNKLGSMVKNWKKMSAKNIQKSLKKIAIQKSGGKFNANLMDDFAENPQNYTPDVVEGANNKIAAISDELFGTSVKNPKSTRQLTGGLAKKKIDPLNKKADLEIEKLSLDPEANFSPEEILEVIEGRLSSIRQKTFPTREEEGALKFFTGERRRLEGIVREAFDEGKSAELTYKEGRDLLKSWQGAAFQEGPVKGNGVVSQVTRGLRELADEKAARTGSQLQEINRQRSEILSTYTNFQKSIRDGDLQNAYVGKDSVSKIKADRMFGEMGRVLDIDLSGLAKSTQFQSAVEGVYKTPSAFGSGSVIGDALKTGIRQTVTEAFAGATIGGAIGAPLGRSSEFASKGAALGAAGGLAKGLRRGAQMSSPDSLVKNFGKIKSRIDNIENGIEEGVSVARGALNPATQLAAQVDQPIAQALAGQPEVPAQDPQAQTQDIESLMGDFDDLELDTSNLGQP